VVFAQQGRKRPDDYRAMGAPPRGDDRGEHLLFRANLQWLQQRQPYAGGEFHSVS
jgi:hypothetical protein